MEGRRARTVVFDLGGVLIEWDPRHLYRSVFDDPDAMERFLAEVATMAWNLRFDAGRPLDEGIDELVALHPHHEDALRAWKTRWIEMVAGPIDGTVEILRRLVDRGVGVVALTNWSVETFPLVRADPAYAFLALFDRMYVSGELRMVKPDPEIYAHVEADLGTPSTQLLFVDDNAANVAAAVTRGWGGHHFDGPDGLRARLVAEGLL